MLRSYHLTTGECKGKCCPCRNPQAGSPRRTEPGTRFRGNDEIRGGLWVFAGGHRDPLPDQAGDRLLRLRPGTGSYDVGGWLGSGEDLWFEILLVDDAGAAAGRPDYEQTLFFGISIRFLISLQPGHRPIDGILFVAGHTGRELP